MLFSRKVNRRVGSAAALLTLLAAMGLGASVSSAADPPVLGEAWSSSVFSSSARLRAEINPNGLATSFHIDYIAKAAYDANVNAAEDGFTGTMRIPASSEAIVGSGTNPVTVVQILALLTPDTAYRYRVVASNSAGTEISPTFTFITRSFGDGSLLLDNRGWEMVSPVDKNGGQVDPPGGLAAGGVLQAASAGGSVTYGSSASFGQGAEGAPPASQYIATREAGGGWSTQNITAPLYSGSYGNGDEGVPYQVFSGDLGRALLLNGRRCRSEGTDCAVANPPLAGTDAPEGYQNYYLRNNAAGSFEALLGAPNAGELSIEPADFEISLAGATADLSHVVLTTCAALTANATEIPLGEGCDPLKPNLYEYSGGAGLSLVNVLPAQTQGTPGAALGAQSRAISANGSRVYWSNLANGNLYLREGSQTKLIVESGAFQTASAGGSIVFYTKAEHLFRYATTTDTSTDLTPAGEVKGVLGASSDGSHVYYMTAAGLFLRNDATTTLVAAAADASNYPPTTGTARVSADGTRLLFLSKARLTGYDNTDLSTGNPDPQVYLYDDTADALTCVSCNPTFGRPAGPSSIPGAVPNGEGPEASSLYKPRALTDDGRRVFFESDDSLGLTDTNGRSDVYEWEASGMGSCTRPAGCVALISSGHAEKDAVFIDASADGSDVFFLTDQSLVKADLPGSVDLYDARVGGGVVEPSPPLACEGDACQSLPPVPVDPTLTTRLIGPGNPAVRYPKVHKHCKGGYVKRKGKCVRLERHKQKRRSHGSGR